LIFCWLNIPPSGSGTFAVSRGTEAIDIRRWTGSIPTTTIASVRKPSSPPRIRTVKARALKSAAAEGTGLGVAIGDGEGVALPKSELGGALDADASGLGLAEMVGFVVVSQAASRKIVAARTTRTAVGVLVRMPRQYSVWVVEIHCLRV
jgi:hypothetical protein